jgi:ferredoxin
MRRLGFMKLVLDLADCVAHGECVLAAPELFELSDGDDVAQLLESEPGEELRAQAEAAVRACPAQAIRLED